jgi:hypothetical protein
MENCGSLVVERQSQYTTLPLHIPHNQPNRTAGHQIGDGFVQTVQAQFLGNNTQIKWRRRLFVRRQPLQLHRVYSLVKLSEIPDDDALTLSLGDCSNAARCKARACPESAKELKA